MTLPADLRAEAKRLARRRRQSLSRFVEGLIEHALEEQVSGEAPDESAIREMAILVAVELGLKLLETSIPGGVTLSKHLIEAAARSAIERVELVEARLAKVRFK